ncbi:hydrogenase maturation nickel metallochaperone HypA [bacterium]|nr:hydrogenase maturation nickel metallochaperone HypA [bacterium]
MLDKLLHRLDYSGLEDIALARVEPFGLHLFEVIFYAFLLLLGLFALRSLLRALAMVIIPPKRELFTETPIDFDVEFAECASCGWTGEVPAFRRRCPKCGSTTLI